MTQNIELCSRPEVQQIINKQVFCRYYSIGRYLPTRNLYCYVFSVSNLNAKLDKD